MKMSSNGVGLVLATAIQRNVCLRGVLDIVHLVLARKYEVMQALPLYFRTARCKRVGYYTLVSS